MNLWLVAVHIDGGCLHTQIDAATHASYVTEYLEMVEHEGYMIGVWSHEWGRHDYWNFLIEDKNGVEKARGSTDIDGETLYTEADALKHARYVAETLA